MTRVFDFTALHLLAPIVATLPLVIAGSGTLTGCGPNACTEIGCQSGTTVEFTTSSWQAGDWTIDLLQEGNSLGSCEVTIPVPSDTVPDCQGQLTLDPHHGGERVRKVRTGYYPSDGSTTTMTIRLSRDGGQPIEESFEASYETSRPNGPGCPPECTNATHQVEIP